MATSKIHNVPREGEGDYTTRPTHIRVFQEQGFLTEDQWSIDGMDDKGMFTETVWSRPTMAEAIADIPDFIAAVEEYGVVWDWRNSR